MEMTVFLLYTVFSQMNIMYKVSDHLLVFQLTAALHCMHDCLQLLDSKWSY